MKLYFYSIWNPPLPLSLVCCLYICSSIVYSMTITEKMNLKNAAKEMFFHGYNNYMKHAFPADELMPLSCKGRFRGSEPSRGDVDDTLGNFSLTLIDSLDTLFIMNATSEFEAGVRKVIDYVSFDTDVDVSVFEVNIRVLGGLLGGHVSAVALKQLSRGAYMSWYTDQLLNLALDIGKRLLPAFNTSTGIPYPRVNLRYGLNGASGQYSRTEAYTCTACAGSIILEFAALSRLTSNPVFEEKAAKAMDYLWAQRNRHSDLMGTVINIHNGDWVRRESGVGAGIDSYYEYLFKAYVMLGDEEYLHRFNTHYSAIQRYVSTLDSLPIPLLLDVQMHRPSQRAKHFMDSLLAFWPGLQVMTGDTRHAIALHEILYQVVQRHDFLPEAFTTDFHVHWGQHPLRPEFVESTYFLYRATHDPHYLEVGRRVIENLQKHARVECGFAAINDVRTMSHLDQMDSFVLAETFKYLYLLFSDPEELPVDLDNYVFTTEAHLLPLSISQKRANCPQCGQFNRSTPYRLSNTNRFCHNQLLTLHLPVKRKPHKLGRKSSKANKTLVHSSPALDLYRYVWTCSRRDLGHAAHIRMSLKSAVSLLHSPVTMNRQTSSSQPDPVLIKAADFQPTNTAHLEMLKRMGIQTIQTKDGNMQLFHQPHSAESEMLSQQGQVFMMEMLKITQKTAATIESRYLTFLMKNNVGSLYLQGGPAQFSSFPGSEELGVVGQVVAGSPEDACVPFSNGEKLVGKIGIVRRGGCMFVEKARNLMRAGAIGGVVLDSNEGTSASNHGFFAMSGDGSSDVSIPMMFLFDEEGKLLLEELNKHKDNLTVLLTRTVKEQHELIQMLIDHQEYLQIDLAELIGPHRQVKDSNKLKLPSIPNIGQISESSFEVHFSLTVSKADHIKMPQSIQMERQISEDNFWIWQLTIYPDKQLSDIYDSISNNQKDVIPFVTSLWSYIFAHTNIGSLQDKAKFKAYFHKFSLHSFTGHRLTFKLGVSKNSPVDEVDKLFYKIQQELVADLAPVLMDKLLYAFVLTIKPFNVVNDATKNLNSNSKDNVDTVSTNEPVTSSKELDEDEEKKSSTDMDLPSIASSLYADEETEQNSSDEDKTKNSVEKKLDEL